jgi:NAD(P)-dependent dehydrogenase (short-subunit alcohol dehydrogenase family)
MQISFRGKNVVVAGGSRGIGAIHRLEVRWLQGAHMAICTRGHD